METVTRAGQLADPDETAADADGSTFPELEDPDWMRHAREVVQTSFWAMARRLPRLVREAIGVAWATSRRNTIASIGLNITAGVMTTFGLLATTTVLTELFAAGPTPNGSAPPCPHSCSPPRR